MDSILMQVMQDRQADAMFLVRASDLRTFANALIQETGNSIAEKTFSAVKYEVGVHALVAHHGRDESCDVKAATRAASIENISFIRTHFKRLLNDCRPR